MNKFVIAGAVVVVLIIGLIAYFGSGGSPSSGSPSGGTGTPSGGTGGVPSGGTGGGPLLLDPVPIPGAEMTFPAPGLMPSQDEDAYPPPFYTSIVCPDGVLGNGVDQGVCPSPRQMCASNHLNPSAPRVCADLDAMYITHIVKMDTWNLYSEMLGLMNALSTRYYSDAVLLYNAAAQTGVQPPSLEPLRADLGLALGATVAYISATLADPYSTMLDPFTSGAFVGAVALKANSPDTAFLAVGGYADPVGQGLPSATLASVASRLRDLAAQIGHNDMMRASVIAADVGELDRYPARIERLAALTRHSLAALYAWFNAKTRAEGIVYINILETRKALKARPY